MQPFPYETPKSEDVDAVAARLLTEGPVVQAATADGRLVWLALSHEAARQVLSDPRFSREAAMGPSTPGTVLSAAEPLVLTSMDPPKHTRTRKLVARAFSPRTVDKLAPRVAEIVAGLLDEVEAHGQPADLVPLFTEPLPIMVICELLGVPYADRAAIRGWAERLMASTAYSSEEITAAVVQIRGYLAELVAAKRSDPGEDLTTVLAHAAEDGDALTEPELLANLQLLLIAGHETTVNQLGNSVLALFRNPGQLALLRERPELIGQAVDELVRYARLMSTTLPRVAVRDVALGGRLIRAGEVVFALVGAADVDPGVFTAPDELDVTRTAAGQHLGFGHGTHYCLGAPLARLELRTALAGLLARFPDLALAVDEYELRWKDGTPVRALRALPVTW
jgi:cytochrome P450